MRAPFPDDIGPWMRLRTFKIGSVYPVIARQRKGLDHDLAEIARVGKRLLITGHGRGKNHFPGEIVLYGRPEGLPLIAGAVFQLKIYCLLHKNLPFKFCVSCFWTTLFTGQVWLPATSAFHAGTHKMRIKKAPMDAAASAALSMNAFVHPQYYSIAADRGQEKFAKQIVNCNKKYG